MKTKLLSCMTFAIALSGCATHPDSISPRKINPAKYAQGTCTQLEAEHYRLANHLKDLKIAQLDKRTTDTAGVLLIGLPLGSMTSGGTYTEAIEITKGEMVAIQDASSAKACPPYKHPVSLLERGATEYQAPNSAISTGGKVIVQ